MNLGKLHAHPAFPRDQLKLFRPRFGKYHVFYGAADQINRPHSDYPARVDNTLKAIEFYADRKEKITWADAKQIHSLVMWNLYDVTQIGTERTRNVHVTGQGAFRPPDPHLLPDMLDCLFPVTPDEDLIDWYHSFEIVHPFIDGNGRVGGIIYTALTFIAKSEVWAPLQ